jgi:hypothetical protein
MTWTMPRHVLALVTLLWLATLCVAGLSDPVLTHRTPTEVRGGIFPVYFTCTNPCDKTADPTVCQDLNPKVVCGAGNVGVLCGLRIDEVRKIRRCTVAAKGFKPCQNDVVQFPCYKARPCTCRQVLGGGFECKLDVMQPQGPFVFHPCSSVHCNKDGPDCL